MPQLLHTYYCTSFRGHWPVGTSAIIRARNKEEAQTLLEIELHKDGLRQQVPLDAIKQLAGNKPYCLILTNGEY